MRQINSASNIEALKKVLKGTVGEPKRVTGGVLKAGGREFTELKKIGSGYNADVFCCTKQGKVLKVGNAPALDVELTIYKDLLTIGFPVLEMKLIDEGVLEKPYVDPNFFGDKLLKTLTEDQKEGLGLLWKEAIRYAIISGIPLDLKADNLWWDVDNKRWLLVDTGPKLDSDDFRKFEFTLDLLNEKDFIGYIKGQASGEWIIEFSKKPGSDEITGLKDAKTRIFFRNIPSGMINWDAALETLHLDVLKIIQTEGDSRGLFYLRFAQIDQEVNDLLKSNIKLAEKSCSVMSDCDSGQKLFKKQVEAIVQLRNDTDIYHKSLPQIKRQAVDDYTGVAYSRINRCLRKGGLDLPCDDGLKKLIVRLEDVLKAKEAPRLKDDVTVYRGINPGMDQTATDVSRALDALQPGDIWEDRGFVSTSVQHPPSEFVGSTCCIFEIFLKAGTPAYYIGRNSSNSGEEEVILLPGILLRYIGKRTGDKGILYGKTRRVNTYMFECAGCGVDNRFIISPSPFEGRGPLFPYQPQDRKVGKDRLGFFHLKDIYNRYIPTKSKKVLRLMTWNVHEWRDGNAKLKKDGMVMAINSLSPDVLALQEVTGPALGSSCKADQGSYGEPLRNEIVVKKTVATFLSTSVSLGSDRCMVVTGIEMPDGDKILVGNLHLDVSSSKRRLENIKKAIEGIEVIAKDSGVKDIILCGDFNSYRREDYDDSAYADLEAIKKGHGEGMSIFEAVEYIQESGYEEAFDVLKSLVPINTNRYGGRIDFIFLSKGFSQSLSGVYAHYSSLSDHISIILDIQLYEKEIEETKVLDIILGVGESQNDYDGNERERRRESKYDKMLMILGQKELIDTCLNPPDDETKTICNDEKFWEDRMKEDYGLSNPKIEKMPSFGGKPRTWKEFYLQSVHYIDKYWRPSQVDEGWLEAKKAGLIDVAKVIISQRYGLNVNQLLKAAVTLGDQKWVDLFIKSGGKWAYALAGAIRLEDDDLIRKYGKLTNSDWTIPFLEAAKAGRMDLMNVIAQKLIYDKNIVDFLGNIVKNKGTKNPKELKEYKDNLEKDVENLKDARMGHMMGKKPSPSEMTEQNQVEVYYDGQLVKTLDYKIDNLASVSENQQKITKILGLYSDDLTLNNPFMLTDDYPIYAYKKPIYVILAPSTLEGKRRVLKLIGKPDNYTQLIDASRAGDLETVQKLIDSVDSKARYSSLSVATEYGHLPIVKYLVEKVKVDPFTSGDQLLRTAKEFDHQSVVEYLKSLSKKGGPLNSLDSKLYAASQKGDLGEVKKLIKAGADPHVGDEDPLRIASENGYLAIVRYLIDEAEADPHVKNEQSLRRASANGHLPVVQYLIEKAGADPHVLDERPLIEASSNGHLPVVRYLIEKTGANPHVKNNDALNLAAAGGHTSVVQYLKGLSKGTLSGPRDKNKTLASPSSPKIKKKPANVDGDLVEAAENGDEERVRYLVEELDADPRVDNYKAIKRAIMNSHFYIVRYLVEKAKPDNITLDKLANLAGQYGDMDTLKFLQKEKAK